MPWRCHTHEGRGRENAPIWILPRRLGDVAKTMVASPIQSLSMEGLGPATAHRPEVLWPACGYGQASDKSNFPDEEAYNNGEAPVATVSVWVALDTQLPARGERPLVVDGMLFERNAQT